MNIYDFDKTIYDGDSTLDFYFFCLKRHRKIAMFFPSLVCAYVKFYIFNIGSKTEFKEVMYRFLTVCDIEKDVSDFWETHKNKIKKWYLDNKKSDDIIISASPEFLLKPLESMYNITVIASVVSPIDGKYTGINCYHSEKVNRFNQLYPNCKIDNFYSDSYSDEPLAKIANRAFIVKGDKISNWKYNTSKKVRT